MRSFVKKDSLLKTRETSLKKNLKKRKKFKNKIEALKVRVKEEPEKAAVLKQAIAKLEKKMMDKEIEIMRQMTTYGTKREKDLEK